MIQNAIVVSPGEVRIGAGEAVLATLGLGSCVAVALHDPVAGIGGLTHSLLPEPPGAGAAVSPGRFVTTSIPLLVERMVAAGADPRRIRARLVGGAAMFPGLLGPGSVPLGTRNIEAARAVLRDTGIALLAEDVGGHHGRSIYFRLPAGTVHVKSIHFPDITL